MRATSQGTGLGLAISQRLVEALGGTIQVESTSGKGSCFWFDLPLPPVLGQGVLNSAGDSGTAAKTVTGYRGKRHRLLLVDDAVENRRILHDLLEPLGFEIAEAADGEACLEKCARQRPDVVLLDLCLGEMDGYEVARTLRKRTDGVPSAIVAVSARTGHGRRRLRRPRSGCSSKEEAGGTLRFAFGHLPPRALPPPGARASSSDWALARALEDRAGLPADSS